MQVKRTIVLAIAAGLFISSNVFAHCDTLDGPVIKDAMIALEKGDITSVLKWVKREKEIEICEAFNKTLAERKKDVQSKELADRSFFELLVKLHRTGEGASFEGLKPVGTDHGAGVKNAEKAIEKGSTDDLINLFIENMLKGVQERFSRVIEKKKHKDESLDAGREYVSAYMEFIHYAEKVFEAVESKNLHAKEEAAQKK